jgi:hypothetical protein
MKQETIEEAAKKYIKLPLDRDVDEEERYYNPNIKSYDAFIAGALWQQQQDKKMYSEEDMKNAYHCGRLYQGFDEFMKQFKQQIT